jgi:hypothetical protein
MRYLNTGCTAELHRNTGLVPDRSSHLSIWELQFRPPAQCIVPLLSIGPFLCPPIDHEGLEFVLADRTWYFLSTRVEHVPRSIVELMHSVGHHSATDSKLQFDTWKASVQRIGLRP